MQTMSRAAAVLLLTGFVPPAAAQLGVRERAFSPRSFPASTTAWSVDCGDLDSDGVPDVVWSDYASARIHWARGLPGGELDDAQSVLPWSQSLVPPDVKSPLAVDLDLDGALDLLCTFRVEPYVGWCRGDGAGGFAVARNFFSNVVGTSPHLAVADLNGDGLQDAIVGAGFGGRLTWIPGTVGGPLGGPVILWAGGTSRHFCPCDLDGDLDLDIALTLTDGNAIVVLTNDGLGNFVQSHVLPTGSQPVWLSAADFDRDGRLDLVSAEQSGATLSVHFAAAGGGFLPRLVLPASDPVQMVDARDLDLDGFEDLVAAIHKGTGSGRVSQWRGTGGQAFSAEEPVMESVGAIMLEVCDLDVDGSLDVIAAAPHYPANGIAVAFASGPGRFEPCSALQLPSNVGNFDLGDFDEDGRMDVALVHSAGYLSILKGDGQGQLAPPTVQHQVGFAKALLARDVDGDLHLDVWHVEAASGRISVAFGDGSGHLTAAQTVGFLGASPGPAAAADIDADGRLDLLVGAVPPQSIAIFRGQAGGTLAPPVFLATPPSLLGIDLGDLDEDGVLDLLAISWPSTHIAFGDGQGGFGAWQPAPVQSGIGQAVLEDLDLDGHLDLAWTLSILSAKSTHWRHGVGDGSFGPESVIPLDAFETAVMITAADLDCDGLPDLLVGAPPVVGVHYNDGLGGFGPAVFHRMGGVVRPKLAEMNGDGRLDLVALDETRVTVQLNRGPSCSPSSYCVAKLNSLGCRPTISSTGTPSAAATSGFVVDCAQVRNQKPGMLFYGFSGAMQVPLLGGTLCVAPPIRRGIAVLAGGNPPPANDCTGVLAMDWNAFSHGLLGGNPAMGTAVAGTEIHCQWWARDQGFAPPFNHSFSDALRFTVGP